MARAGCWRFYAGAVDPRIRATAVLGYFGPREGLWREPIYRTVPGLLREFGDAELALLVDVPAEKGKDARHLLICDGKRPTVSGPPAARPGRSGAAPGEIEQADEAADKAEYKRIAALAGRPGYTGPYYCRAKYGEEPALCPPFMWSEFLSLVGARNRPTSAGARPTDLRKDFEPKEREHRQFDQLVAFTQKLMRESDRATPSNPSGRNSTPPRWKSTKRPPSRSANRWPWT